MKYDAQFEATMRELNNLSQWMMVACPIWPETSIDADCACECFKSANPCWKRK